MRVVDLIERKRFGGALSTEEIAFVVDGYCAERIPDYQMSALLMAVACRGMCDEETAALTDAMLRSGETLDLSTIPGVKVDKHSTGGVGDKTTLAVVPILAAAGIPVAKMSGRGLGHTGGTLDKLESIPGYRTALTTEEIVAQVSEIGACIVAQTSSIVPADKKMYALRDVTGTVASLPLIASSIMSKKLACGADAIVLDVKCGRGALVAGLAEARELAVLLVLIGEARGKRMTAALTNMDIPLGAAVGNWLEVREVRDLLLGKPVDSRLRDEVLHLSRLGLAAGGKDPDDAERLLASGDALRKFTAIVQAQGGDIDAFDLLSPTPATDVLAVRSGYIADIDALAIGRASVRLGAGRETKDSIIDPLAGIVVHAGIGTEAAAGQPIATLYGRRELAEREHLAVAAAFTLTDAPPRVPPLVYEVLHGQP